MTKASSDQDQISQRRSVVAAAAFSLPLLALALAVVVLPFGTAFRVVSLAIVFSVEFLLVVFVIVGFKREKDLKGDADRVFDKETEEKLQVLEEAGRLFENSLRLNDMFRLLAARASGIVPLEECGLYHVGADDRPAAEPMAGTAPSVMGREVSGLAESSVRSRTVKVRVLEKEAVEERWTALPLVKAGKVFAVMTARPMAQERDDRSLRILLEALAERISPIIAASIALDETESKALVDGLTGLPNGRAFELVLENRVAEAQRFKDEAPLVVLALDLKDFSSVNLSYGHGTGDRVLVFASEVIRSQLRKMDFLARTQADEFLAVLPAAGPAAAGHVIKRLGEELASRQFPLPGGERLTIGVNSGSAAFGPECGTATELVIRAREDRDRIKPRRSNQVLRFPTKHSN